MLPASPLPSRMATSRLSYRAMVAGTALFISFSLLANNMSFLRLSLSHVHGLSINLPQRELKAAFHININDDL